MALVLQARLLSERKDIAGARHSRVDRDMPLQPCRRLGRFDLQRLPVVADRRIDIVVLYRAAARMLAAEQEGQDAAGIRPVGLPGPDAVPGDIGISAAHVILVAEVLTLAENRMGMAERDHMPHK